MVEFVSSLNIVDEYIGSMECVVRSLYLTINIILLQLLNNGVRNVQDLRFISEETYYIYFEYAYKYQSKVF